MKLKKITNGNVLVLSDNGEVITSLLPSTMVHAHPRHSKGVQLTQVASPQHEQIACLIYSDQIALEKDGKTTPWTGTRSQLIEKLSSEFFFSQSVSGGSGIPIYETVGDFPPDTIVGSVLIAKNTTGTLLLGTRKRAGLWRKDNNGFVRLGNATVVANNVVVDTLTPDYGTSDLQSTLQAINNEIGKRRRTSDPIDYSDLDNKPNVPDLSSIYNTSTPFFNTALDQFGAKALYDELDGKINDKPDLLPPVVRYDYPHNDGWQDLKSIAKKYNPHYTENEINQIFSNRCNFILYVLLGDIRRDFTDDYNRNEWVKVPIHGFEITHTSLSYYTFKLTYRASDHHIKMTSNHVGYTDWCAIKGLKIV